MSFSVAPFSSMSPFYLNAPCLILTTFLNCIQVSYEASKVVQYSHLFKNFPQFVVIHTVKGFSIVNEAEVDVFLKFPCFFYDPTDVGNLISGSSALSKSQLFLRPPQTTISTSCISSALEWL